MRRHAGRPAAARRRRRSCSTSSTSGTSRPISRSPGCGGCASATGPTWRWSRCRRPSTPIRSATFLGGDVVRSEGRMFDVAIEHLPAPDDRPLAAQVAGAVRRVLRDEPTATCWCSCPGAGEIRRAPGGARRAARHRRPRRAAAARRDAARGAGARRAPGDRRKVILSTNVAEIVGHHRRRGRRDRLGPGADRGALAVDGAADAGAREDQPGRGHAARRPRRPHAPGTRAAPLHAPRLRAAAARRRSPRSRAPISPSAALALRGARASATPTRSRWLEPPPAAAWGAARELLAPAGRGRPAAR